LRLHPLHFALFLEQVFHFEGELDDTILAESDPHLLEQLEFNVRRELEIAQVLPKDGSKAIASDVLDALLQLLADVLEVVSQLLLRSVIDTVNVNDTIKAQAKAGLPLAVHLQPQVVDVVHKNVQLQLYFFVPQRDRPVLQLLELAKAWKVFKHWTILSDIGSSVARC
jgi:hypothetical protein